MPGASQARPSKIANGRAASILVAAQKNKGWASPPEFAIAEDHELQGRWADKVEVEGYRELVAINVDRLATEFLRLL